MKDSFGSVFNLTLLFAFILVVSGFVLFGVNYYKAFQVKNNLLTLIEKYEGNVNNDKFKEKVESLLNRVGYHPGQSAIDSLQNKNEIIGLVLMKKVGATAILINQNGKMDKRLDTMM